MWLQITVKELKAVLHLNATFVHSAIMEHQTEVLCSYEKSVCLLFVCLLKICIFIFGGAGSLLLCGFSVIGMYSVVGCGFLTVVTSLAAEHGLRCASFRGYGARA